MTDVELAVENLKRAIKREAQIEPLRITTFMGLTPAQIVKLIAFYETYTKQKATDL